MRTLACISSSSRAVVSPFLCPTNERPASAEKCVSSCEGPHWSPGPWSACNATCGGGIHTRSVECLVGGKAVGPEQCYAAGQIRPATDKICSPWPCETFTWSVGPWGPCGAACGGSLTKRHVACVNSLGSVLPFNACSGAGPMPAATAACNTAQCNPCAADPQCNGNGNCTTTVTDATMTPVCACDHGYGGSDCGQHQPCQAESVLDSNGACCVGVRDRLGDCCPQPARLDACGECNGTNASVDASGVCCNGLIDGAGMCCPGNKRLDVCGVCEGAGTTCGVHIRYTVKSLHALPLIESMK